MEDNIKTLEKLLDVNLNYTQEGAWLVIRWLLDDSLETVEAGRTTLMALAFISMAISHPNQPVHIFDHHWQPRHYGYRVMEQVIKGLLNRNKSFAKQFKLSPFHQELTYVPKKK